MQCGAMIMASMQHNVAVMPHNPQASPLTNYAVVAMRDSVGVSCCARCVCVYHFAGSNLPQSATTYKQTYSIDV
jgi:hypothetical protein